MAIGDQEIFIALVGAGVVGSQVLKQLNDISKSRGCPRFRLCYFAVIDRAFCYPDYEAIDIPTALETLEAKGTAPHQIHEIVEYLASAPARTVLLDNTSSGALAAAYPLMLRKGISLVTPNKKGFSGAFALWQEIFAAAFESHAFVFHESSVGAGMPIISTINDLMDTGDEITRIEGVFSGTLSYLLNSFSSLQARETKWSEQVKRAKELGYTEPDPRDDLNGMDVARKLTIVGRLAGLPIESPAAFPVESLIPAELEGVTNADDFLARLPEYDNLMEQRRTAAVAKNQVLRYIGSVDVRTKHVKVGLEQVDQSHPAALLKGSDNIISIYTKRYGEMPLTIRGAGAGGSVTAMGVTSDLLKVLRRM